MKFTLVITTFNSEKYIEEAIKSAINQVRKPDEIIICDDNSSDNTINICNKYLELLSVHINPEGPSGFTNAFNYALKLGTGDFITILHFDDVLHPNFFQQAELALNKHPNIHFLTSKNFYFESDVNLDFKIYSEPQFEHSLKLLSGKDYSLAYLNGVKKNEHINRCPGSIFYRTLPSKIYFRREAGLISDDDLFYRIGTYTDVLQIELPLAGVRLHNQSESGKMNALHLNSELAKSYYFLINDWDKNSIIGINGLESFISLFNKFNFRTLFFSILTENASQISISVNQHRFINSLYQKENQSCMNSYQKVFFYLAEKKHNSLLRIIVKFSNQVLRWRNHLS